MSMSGPLTFAGFMVVTLLMLVPDRQPVEEGVAAPPVTATQPLSSSDPRPNDFVGNGYASQELRRSADGHFYAEAQVNGAQVRFLIDTGASFVALTAGDAQRAGISPGSERALTMAAGGAVEVKPVTIDRVAIGSLAATHVSGAIIDDLPVSLLGQTFLSRIGSVRIEGDRMILR